MSPSELVPVEPKPWTQVILRSVVLLVCCGIPAIRFMLVYPPHVVAGSLYGLLLLGTIRVSAALITALIARDWYGLTHGMPLISWWLYGWGLVLGLALNVGMVFLELAYAFAG